MKIALKASGGQFVCADEGKKHALIANRPAVGPWETFEILIVNEDGSLTPITPDTIAPPDTTPPDTPPAGATDAFDLGAAIVASGDCPSVAGLPILAGVGEITVTDVGPDGQGYAMNWPGRDTWPEVVPPGWEGGINHTLWMAEFIGGLWYVLPVKEGLGTYLTLGPILAPGQVPDNLCYYARPPMCDYQPAPGELVGFFCTTGDTRRMNLQPPGAGRTNVVLVPFRAGHYTFP